MSNSTITTGAKEVTEQKPMESQKMNHVHIGVFFDGTSNNMVQKAYFHNFKYKVKKEKEKGRNKNETVEEKGEDRKKYEAVKDWKKAESKDLEKLQITPNIETKSMFSDSGNGYSNIAILYSLLKNQTQTQTQKEHSCFHNIYIEGSGATDIVHSRGGANSWNEKNINGLGFGLGKTGVTALVSKAIKNIYEYLNSIRSQLEKNTQYHFYVFGFSRGATCGRLFTELVTRDISSEALPREYEFGQETSKVKNLYKNGRLHFMEEGFIPKLEIDRNKVKVEFLGIYDTVASIGFLKQKDGWTNSLSWGYRVWPNNNYQGNFHYMNARDYGLYSHQNSNVTKVCHICAGDEFRENFALVNLGKELGKNAIELVIPGCHSDVGGGYVDEIGMDVVLYKFIPRKLEHFIKSNKIFEIIGYPYLKQKERAKMFLENPMDEGSDNNVSELNPVTLSRLGWIDKKYDDPAGKVEIAPDGKAYTLRVADWENEIKFKRFVRKGYSYIPLAMMKKCFDECKFKIEGEDFKLFNEINEQYNYEKIKDLKDIGDRLMNHICEPNGTRKWIIPDKKYNSEAYRNLRLHFLHFTSSCELIHMRTLVSSDKMHEVKKDNKDIKSDWLPVECNPGNFGNNCNYDDDANICRIMYDGDKKLEGDHKDNVHYMYEFDEYGMEIDY